MQDATQAVLLEIWRDVLEREDVGADDDFYLLGGNERRAKSVVAQVRALLEIEISTQAFVDAPTIAGLCAVIERDGRGEEVEARAALLLRVSEMSEDEVAEALGTEPQVAEPESEDITKHELVSREALQELNRRSDLRGFVRLATHFGMIAATAYGVHAAMGSWLVVPAILVHGFMLGALLCPLHECCHGVAFKSRRINEIAAALCGIVVLNPAAMFREYHFKHHRYTSIPGKDPEFNVHLPKTKLEYVEHVAGWVELRRIGRVLVSSTRSIRGELAWMVELRIILVGCVLVIGSMIVFQTLAPLYYWVIPLIIGTILIADVQGAEHTGCPIVPNMLRNTRTTLTNPVMRFLLWNMSYHCEHHSFPSVPFHALPKLHRLLGEHVENVEQSYLQFYWRMLRGVREPLPPSRIHRS